MLTKSNGRLDVWRRLARVPHEYGLFRRGELIAKRILRRNGRHSRGDDVRVPAATLAEQVSLLLRAWGLSEEHTLIATEMMLYADLRGIDSHGIGMLPTYRTWRERGWLNFQPTIQVVRQSSATGLIDGDGSLGHIPSNMAMKLAIEKCRTTGVGAVAVRNSSHFGAAGAYVSLALEEGFIGLATTSAPSPAIVPTFGLEPMLGTNPIAFAAPARKRRPFVLDMATSTVAIGKLTVALRRGLRIPRGWAVDGHGRPLTDAKQAARTHLMTPLGNRAETSSHKGYDLAAMVEILSSILSGNAWNVERGTRRLDSNRQRVGHFFLAIDPAGFRAAGDFQTDVDAMIDALHGCRRADPRQPVLVAGDPEHAAYADRNVNGIPLCRSLVRKVRGLTREASVPFLFDELCR